jgi:Terminase RNaseH-like domain/Terminase large subunit, T4likevirus-type, N-terminal
MTQTTEPSGLAISLEGLFRDLDYEPHEGQWEVHRSPAGRRVLACGVRWGKSRCAAMEGIAAALEPRKSSVGWVVAPTYDLADKVFREIVVVAAEKLRHRIVTLRERDKLLVLRNMAGGLSEIRGKSADNPVSLLGEGLDWLIVDEAARMRPEVWQGHLSQRLIDKRGWALLISTPRGRGWFYGLFRMGKDPEVEDVESWNAPSWQNPHLDRDLIEAERERLPERVFRQEYGGEFVEGSGAVFRYVRKRARGDWQDPSKDRSYYAGLDLAKVEDYTVLAIMDDKRRLVFADRFNRIDWSLQIERIREATKRYRNPPLLVDSTGKGEPIYEALRAAGCEAKGYQFTARSKAALIDNLAMMFERNQIRLPDAELWPEGIDELESFQYSITDSGNVKSTAPHGQHDDCVIALALAAWQVRPDKPLSTPYIMVVPNPFPRDNWF